jgi:urease gamma subunit
MKIGFYEAIQKTLRKYKGIQLNYDSAIKVISIEVTEAVLDVFQSEVDRIFDELRKEMGVKNGK